MSRPQLFNCLIRTHHITSRKKVQRVRRAASQLNVDWLLIRSGSSPGLMFAEGPDETRLADWVAAVQALRYKDFQCVRKPAPAVASSCKRPDGFHEVDSTAAFAKEMEAKGLSSWWRKAMGYEAGE
ncbi:hypothetical protein B0I35DRAFT_481512 [Stachybotrys elegans]|uniref:Uncharacterized protein n=1 Tax=Stachybotrys elegans TaxID=80388 RepID=A0A8K0WMX8_9HYPO|nr:hypothetical protein B0I35DRAFT_481512 [Stachybotrys elegans]